jgi:hypothetical protein
MNTSFTFLKWGSDFSKLNLLLDIRKNCTVINNFLGCRAPPPPNRRCSSPTDLSRSNLGSRRITCEAFFAHQQACFVFLLDTEMRAFSPLRPLAACYSDLTTLLTNAAGCLCNRRFFAHCVLLGATQKFAADLLAILLLIRHAQDLNLCSGPAVSTFFVVFLSRSKKFKESLKIKLRPLFFLPNSLITITFEFSLSYW